MKKMLSKKNIEDILALTPMQEGMLYHYLKEPESALYFEQLSLEVSGELRWATFKKTWNAVIATNEMLRTVFRWEKVESPIQLTLKEHMIRPERYDCTGKNPAEERKRLEEIKAKDREKKFHLTTPPFRVTLCKIGGGKHVIIISNHHILYDGWSNGIILEEFFRTYNRLADGQEIVKSSKTRFKEFVKKVRTRETTGLDAYWQEYLAGSPATSLPLKKRSKARRSYPLKHKQQWSKETYERLAEYLRENRSTMAAMLYSAWGILLQRYNNTRDVVFGTTVSGRSATVTGIEKMVGLFINTLPVRVTNQPGEVSRNMNRRINSDLRERQAYESTPLVKIAEFAGTAGEELFETIVVIENYPLDSRLRETAGTLTPGAYSTLEMTHYDLTVVVSLMDEITVDFIFNPAILEKKEVKRIAAHYLAVVEAMLKTPLKEPHLLDILTEKEKQRILYDFNRTGSQYPKTETIPQLFEKQVETTPDAIAIIGTTSTLFTSFKTSTISTTSTTCSLTYRELNRETDLLSRELKQKGVRTGIIVGIMVERSVEMAIGVLGILKAGGAYLPVNPGYPTERISYMLADSSVQHLLTVSTTGNRNEFGKNKIFLDKKKESRLAGGSYNSAGGAGSACSACSEGRGNSTKDTTRAQDPAYIIYTSGTTGKPKGVMVSHKNVIRLVKNTNFIKIPSQARLLQTGALEFDASTFEIWGSLLNGAGLVLVDKDTILDHCSLKKVINCNNITIMWMTSPMFNQVEDIEIFAGLEYLLVGGDALSPAHINRVKRAYPSLKLINGYGPTENTTFSTTHLITNSGNKNERIPIGTPIANSSAYIVDKYGNPVPAGIPGELLVGGDGVARGYLNNPQLTHERFIPNPFIKAPQHTTSTHLTPKTSGTHLTPQTLYRTGDLVRMLPDGTIDFLERIDRQVKIRGFRIELGEIENRILEHEGVKEAVVIAREDAAADKYLCAYFVPAEKSPLNEPLPLKTFLSQKLPVYMVPAYFVKLEKIPLATTGKVDKAALPQPGNSTATQYAAPRNEQEEQLVRIYAEVLATDAGNIGIDDSFFYLGGHSLKATRLVSKIHKKLNVSIPLSEIFNIPTIRGLSAYIEKAAENKFLALQPAKKKENYSLSSAQKRLFLLQQLDTGSTVYNISETVQLEGTVDREKLEETFRRLLARHESLRTSFKIIDREPVQEIHPPGEVTFSIEYYDIEGQKNKEEDTARIIKQFIRPFDLSVAPLLRVGLIKPDENTTVRRESENPDQKRYILLINMHHIIADGTSVRVFEKEFMELYNGATLSPQKIQYKDYSEWQNSTPVKKALKEQEEYWLKQYTGELPVLTLPCDYSRPTIKKHEGNRVEFNPGEEKNRAIYAIARETGTTLYMTLSALFTIFLHKISGSEDIITGTPTAGRRHGDLENVIGMFVNTLCMRNRPESRKTFREFLPEVKQGALDAFKNQEYPFEELVEKVAVNRDTGRNPIFDVLFVLQNAETNDVSIPGLTLSPYPYQHNTAKFDITLEVIEKKDKLHYIFEYSTELFKKETIERFIGYFKTIIASAIGDTGQKISGLEVLPAWEKQRLLIEFNDTENQYPHHKTLHRIFLDQVQKTPGRISVVGPLPTGKNEKLPQISYRQLNEKANRLAGILIQKGVTPGTIVALLVERSLEMIVAIYAILKTGAAYLPILPHHPAERTIFILEDSNPPLLITTGDLAKKISFDKEIIKLDKIRELNEFGELKARSSLHMADSEKISAEAPNTRYPIPDTRHPASGNAYIIYTSGSTGTPRGVLVEHRSAVNILTALQERYPLGETGTYLLKTSYMFDVSVTEIFGWYFGGGRLALLEKGGEKEPSKILAAVERAGVTHINFVPGMFNIFVEALNSENISKLSRLEYIFLAGEALKGQSVAKFRHLDSKTALENIYGPTEATIYAAGYSLSQWKENEEVPIGKPMPNYRLYILDGNNNIQPLGVPGELCIAGVGLARGYLNRPELTAEKFVNFPNNHYPLTTNILYRTGDLCRWQPDGNIEYLGRMDFQVKIRGYRIEPGEIETQLLKHDEVREAVVIAGEDSSKEKYLCAYVTQQCSDTGTTAGERELREYLAARLPEYMVPSYIVIMETLPLTPTGKIDRKALPLPELKAGDHYAPPTNESETKLLRIWSEVLGLESNIIGIDANFFHLGGHSFKAFKMISRIMEIFDIKLPMSAIFEKTTIRGLAELLRGHAGMPGTPRKIKPAGQKEYYALSSAQKRMYLTDKLNSGSTVYNMPVAMTLEGRVEREKLENVFRQLLLRHESFRTAFKEVEGEPVQQIKNSVEFKLSYHEGHTPATSPSTEIAAFIRPFDLATPPLLRAGLLRIRNEEHLLMVDMPHIVSDGTSMGILSKDFMTLYGGEQLAPLEIHYKDYSEWQNQTREKTRAKQQEKYWLKQFEGEIPELNLPTDYPRPVRRTFEGKTLLFRSDRGETAALKSTAHRQGATLYMVLRAIFDTFLSRLSGQEAIIIGTPVAGRGHADLNGIIGMFVNTLALRSYPGGAETYAGHLEKIKQNTLEAFENQDYPFEKLVEKLGINRENSRRPLFDVMFLMQNMELPEIEIPGLKLKPYHYENKTAKFELTLQGMEVGEELEFRLAYSTKLFEEETIHRYITYFKRMLATVPGEPGSKLAGIEILSPQEKQQILQNFNDTAARYPKTKTLAQLFEEQVEKSPGNLALAYENKQLTYKELNEKTNRLAERLSAEGAIPGSIVAMETERSLEMIIGIMAVLKTGAAYMPVAPEYPGDRKRYMIKDSGAKILIRKISRENLQEKLNADCKIIDININAPGDTNSFNTSNTFNTSELAYLIYTSGTTGKPKGAAIENRQVVNLVKALEKRIYRYGEPVGISLVSPYIFDASVKQIFPALLLGHTLEVVPEHIRFDGDRLVQFYKKKKIRVADGTPFHLKLILNAHRELGTDFPVQRFVIGGEQLERDQAEKIIRTIRRDDFKIVNVYGPTECCDVTTTYDIDMKTLSQERKVPIGKPIANVNVYIVGPGGNLQGIGIPGELWIGGNGLGRGYLNRPETTHERFIPNPFNKPAKDTTSTSGTPGTLYKTGDLARWRSDGNIEYLGRIDHQVKIRGFRIELGEIESQLLEHRDIKEAVVIVKGDTKGENKEDRYLCAYIVPAREIPVRRIREYLTGKLPAYMLPSKIAVIEAVPVTANGKIDRRALPEPGKETAGTFIAPQGEVEKTLADLWAQALKIDIKQIGIDDNFFHLGGHSLKAMQLTAKIHNRLNVALQLPQLFAKPTIRALAAYIETAAQEKFQPIKAVEKKKYYPLSPAQKRMYLLQQMENSGTGYNMPLAVLLEGDLERKRLEKTFRKLLERHESFRTAFDMREGEAVQVIYKAAALEFGIRYYGNVGGGEREEAVIEEFIRPFDLTRAPLVRAALLEKETGAASTPAHILILDMHHIISDGVSFGIFVGDFIKLFNNEELSPLEIQYKDFSEWQNNRVKTRGLKKEQAWWRQKFERELEVLELPYDYPRPPLQSFAGSSIYSEIGKQQAAGIRELAVKEEATLFMVVNALYGVLLSRLARREEIVVGVPTAGRGHAHLEQVIGMFVNTLPLRSNPGGDRTFETYLRETGKETLLAFENQALPFEEMVGQLNVERELSRNPLFDVMFTLDNIEHAGAEIPGLRLTPYKRENRDAKFDLTLIATEKGEKIQLEYEYCTALFKEETVRRFDTVFQRIIGAVLENPGIRLEQIDIAADEEKQRILYEFNEPPVEYPKHKTIHGLVEEQALKRPDRLAVSSIPQRNGGETGELTFRGLNEKARALAVLLRQKGIGPGRIVGIMVTPSLEMTVGILAVLKAGGAWLPISPGYTVERTAYMMGDSNAALMLTQAGTKEKAGQIATKVKEITKQNAPGIILIDGHFKSKNKDTQKMLPSTGTSNPAYIIYTSGSTGKPKGVVVPHSAFVNRLYSLKRRFRFDEGDVILQKAANTFDVSVCELFRGLVWGARLVVAGTEVNKDMEELVRIIETYKVTVIEFVPIVLNLFLEHIKNHGEIGRVSRLRQAFVGGEAVDSETVKLFHRRMYEPCGTRLVNAYGPTEAAVDVAWYDCTAAKAGEVPPKIPIGKPIDNTRLLILDRALQLVPTGVPGELCVAGDSLASGYLNRPELTTETFIKNRNSWSAAPSFPNNQSPITDNQSFSNNQSSITDNRLYRTGDLARWQPDGNIEFMGRIDRQLKIRGFRIEPGEIENRLMQQKNVKEAVVIAREYKTQKEDKYLCAYIVTEGGTRSSGAAGDSGAFALSKELEKNLSMELPGYMVPSYYIRLEAVPLTANGKVDVKALPEPAQEIVGEQYTAPRNAAEKKLAAMWAQVLERDESRIGIDDNFFYMGGHSLKAAQLIAGIHKAMGVTVQYPELFAGPTIRALAASIETAAKETGPAIKAEEKKEYYPLSSAQKRMHLQQQMESAGTGYNMPLTVLLEGTPDRKRLENTLGKLIARHESLRTSFQEKDGENVQVIHEPREIEFCVQYEDKPGDKNPGKSDEAFFEGFICPFDLTRAPLMRVALRKREKNAGGTPTYMLILDMHHIISDGVSFEIFIGEFMELYAGKELRPLALQYRDYSEWQNRAKETDRVKKQETYWLKQFEGNVPEMRLPTDYPRPVRRSFVGKTLIFGIEKGETAALKNTALRQGATIYMVLSAIFNSFLSRLSGQEDIVIGTPAAGRGHAGLEGTIGMFVNTLAMRNRLRAEQTYGEFLNNVKETTLEAFENQDYQFEELVGKLDISRDASRSPLFDVMFQMQNMETTEIEIPGLKLSPFEYDTNKVKFDLTLQGMEVDGELEFRLSYGTKLFKEETILRYIRYFKRILSAVVAEPGRKLSEIELLSPREKQQLLYDFNETAVRYPGNKTLGQLFEEQAARTPDRIAIVGPETNPAQEIQLTYRRLEEMSRRQAAELIQKGLEPGTITGIMAERSIPVIIGILGILKAGGAYMPIDPDYPQERIEYILRDSGAKIVLKGSREIPRFAKQLEEVEVLNLKEINKNISETLNKMEKEAGIGGENLPEQYNPDQSPPLLSYIIYTSGSTGKPKGVMVEHASVVNLAYYQKKRFKITEDDRVLQFSSLCFDASVEQLFIALLSGATLVLAAKETFMDNLRFDRFTARQGLTHINAVPSFLMNMGLKSVYSIRRIVSGGDVCPPALAEKWSKNCEFYNQYGPTETTVTAIAGKVPVGAGTLTRLPVGKPIANTAVYLLDKNMKPVPGGTAGELHIGGEGITRGYLNRPELTHERFIPNPFIPAQDTAAANNHTTSVTPVSSSTLYKTGDLCRWLPDGTLQFLDRLDSQVKIRGFRIEPGEIETLLTKQETVSEAVVRTWKRSDGDRYLCAYVVYKGTPETDAGFTEDGTTEKGARTAGAGTQLRERLAETLPDYMIPAYFVKLERMPLNSSGKIDRTALPEPATPELETRVAPRNNVEEKLAEIWSQLLKIEQSRIGIDDNFFHLGGHSLKATRLIARIHSALNVEVPLPELFAKPTIRALSAYIETSGHDKFISIKAVEKKENYPLSSAQKRMFLLQQMESTGTGYNMPLVVRLEGTLDRERLENIFRELIDRHESFRTTFEMRNGEAVQVIHNAGKIEIHVEYYETSGREKNEEDIIDGLIRPFDLSCAPLVRVGVIKKENTVASTPTHILVLDMHHIISDGVSFGILVRDLMSLFKGDELAPLRIQYKDFSEWQNRLFKTPEIKKQQAWWHRKFERKIEVMELPYDYPRPPTQSFAGSSFYSEINKTKTAALTEQALKHEVTLFMELVALYSILLSRLSNREEVVVGVPTAGRSHADLEPVIGMFVNTLPLRSKPGGDKTFESFLEEVGRQTLQAFENQALPFEELVEQLEVERSLSRNPLFDVMFTLNNMEISRVEIPGLRLTPYKRENKDAKFDLTLSATEEEDKIHLEYEYCTALFKEETVRRFDTIFQRIIDAVLETPDIKLAKIEIIPGEEKKRILYEFNETAVEYPRHETIHGLVEKQAQKHPDRLAVSSITQIREGETGELTFGRLNDKSHALAVVLRQKGIGPGRIVGIMDTPSLETVVGMLGVLKAGGAWLPTAPGTSTERIAYMLADSNATLLLTRTRHKEKAKEIRDKVEKITTDAPGILLIDEPIKPGAEDTHPPLPGRDAANTAYIIYTSGSTGQPKGVAVPHRAFVNRQYSLKRRFHIDEGDVVLQKASNTFDVSVCELFRGLSWGAAVVIAGTVVDTDMEELVRIIETYKVTLLEFVPIVLNLFLEYIDNHGAAARVARLRQAFVGGEAVESETVKRFHRVIYERCGTQLVNAYGPTEAAVDVSWYDCTGGNAGEVPVKIPIGKPIANTTIVIIDRNLQLMPIGIPGELCIAGDSLGSGYLNRPELTAEKFAKNLRTRPADTPNNQSPITNNRLYRTGDLARWQPDGNIEFMGRIDRQLKIRGFRIEPGEIENLLLQHEKVKEAVVLAREYKAQKGDKYLCAYIVTGGTQEAGDTMEVAALTKELESCLSKELPGYMVPQYFIELETVPLTVNGKVDVNTLPEPVAKGKSERYAAPQSDIEKKLVEMWSQLLEIDRKNIGIDDNFFRLGGHSLKAFVLVSKIHKHLNVKMSPAEIFKQPTIRSMAQFIKTMVEDKWETIEPLEKREHYPLSSAQSRLFTLNVIEDDNVVYNLPAVWQLKGKLSLSKFEEAFQTMAARHESLRTSFQIRAGEPVQVIEENVEPTVEYHVTEAGSDKEQYSHTTITQFLRPFDLSKAPLLRVALIRLEEEKHLLLMDIHHIISDGVTMVILVNEFIRLYENKELPRLTIQYKDFAQWQNRFFRSKAFKKQENYWQEIFKDGAPLLNMPLDYPRTRERRPEGKILPFTIDKELTHRLKSCASETGVTLYMTLLAIYNILLSRYSGQEDIVVGLPIAGRKHADLENIAGFFINTLAIRNQPENRHTFNGFMQKVKENVLKAYDNQDYPFDRLVSNLKIPKDMSRNPLFDAMLVLQNTAPLDTFESLELGAYDFEHNISHFDLHLEATEYEGKINMKLEYATALFKRETAEEFTRHYIELTRQVMENTNIQLKELEISFDLLVSRSSILDEDQGDFGF